MKLCRSLGASSESFIVYIPSCVRVIIKAAFLVVSHFHPAQSVIAIEDNLLLATSPPVFLDAERQ
ncbi:Hypothetical protein ABZS17D1_01589 [Kosakonia cowanii]|jgi:hypothetical protein